MEGLHQDWIPDWNKPNERGFYIIHQFVTFLNEDIKKSKELIDISLLKGMDVDIRATESGETALHLAIQRGHIELAEHLVEKNANILLCDNKGNSALHFFLKKFEFNLKRRYGTHNFEIRADYNTNKDYQRKSLNFIMWSLSEGIDPLQENENRETPFSMACKYNVLEIIKIFTKDENNLRNYTAGNSILFYLLENVRKMYKWNFDLSEIRETVNTIKLLLEKGLQINWGDKEFKPFHYALTNCRCKFVINTLLPSFTGEDVLDSDGSSVLHLLIKSEWFSSRKLGRYSFIKTAKELLMKGADVDARDSYQLTPLLLAVTFKFKELAEILIKNGASVHFHDIAGDNPLHVLSTYCHHDKATELDLVELLVQNRCNLNETNNFGLSPLHKAAMNGCGFTVQALISHGAKLTFPNSPRIQPIHLAAEYDSSWVVKIFLDAGVNVNERCSFGRTPLHYAVKLKNENVIFLLLKYGADVNLQDQNGNSPLHEAFNVVYDEIIMTFIRQGADINLTNRFGATPAASDEYMILSTSESPFNRYLMKMKAAGFSLNRDCNELLKRSRCEQFLTRCREFLESIKYHFFSLTKKTFLELLHMKPIDFYGFKDNADFEKALFSEYTDKENCLYAEILQDKFSRALKMKKVLEPAKEAFWKNVNSHLTEHCIEKIFFYMDIKDVDNFLKCYKKKSNTKEVKIKATNKRKLKQNASSEKHQKV